MKTEIFCPGSNKEKYIFPHIFEIFLKNLNYNGHEAKILLNHTSESENVSSGWLHDIVVSGKNCC